MRKWNKKVLYIGLGYAVVVLFSLTGCASSKYACKGMPEGVVCADPVQVYEMTEDADSVTGVAEGGRDRVIAEKAAGGAKKEEVIESVLRPPVDMVKPVLEPAQVLRIWVAPWVDADNDLHWSTYVFTEITPRRWSLGSYGYAQSAVTYPLQLRGTSSVPSIAVPPVLGKGLPAPDKSGGSSREVKKKKGEGVSIDEDVR